MIRTIPRVLIPSVRRASLMAPHLRSAETCQSFRGGPRYREDRETPHPAWKEVLHACRLILTL